MLFIPPSIPTSSTYKIMSNLDISKVDTTIRSELASLESLRYHFWSSLTHLMQSPKKLQNAKFWMEKKAYLYETINLLKHFTQYGNMYCQLSYWSVFGNELGHCPFNVAFASSGESVATVEIILSRYAYSFALLASQKDIYCQLEVYRNNKTAIIDKIKEIMDGVEDAAVRMAKFNRSKKLIWAGLDEATVKKYINFPELN